MSNAARILLLDDHPAILDGLKAHLEGCGEFQVVAACTDPDEALQALAKVVPELAILDIRVRGGMSFEFVTIARQIHPEMRIVFITGFDDDVLLERAFEVGASAFVLKSDPLTELTAAVQAVARGERYISQETRRRFPGLGGALELHRVPTRLALLTPREREVLRHVSMGKSAKEISKILKISTWTVTNHKANIMAKLDIHNQVGLARFAFDTGLTKGV